MLRLPVWLLAIALSPYLLLRIVRYRIFLKMPLLALYLAFWTVATPLLATCEFHYGQIAYWHWYWPLQGIGYMLSALLSLSLLYTATSDYRRRLDILAGLGIVVLLPFITAMGAGEWHPWLTTVKWADLACAFLLIWGLLLGKHWTEPYEGIAWGMMAGLSGHILCALVQGDQDPGSWLRLLYQVAGIVQLLIWVWVMRVIPTRSAR